MAKLKTITCPICSKIFTPSHGLQVYDSSKCKELANYMRHKSRRNKEVGWGKKTNTEKKSPDLIKAKIRPRIEILKGYLHVENDSDTPRVRQLKNVLYHNKHKSAKKITSHILFKSYSTTTQSSASKSD